MKGRNMSDRGAGNLADRLTEDARRILPGLRFCGGPDRDLAGVDDDLLAYLVSLPHDSPVPAPTLTAAS